MSASGAASAQRAARGTILVVDDEQDMRFLLRAILEPHYHVAEADSAAALHHALETHAPDLVLLDMKLPDANGLGLLPAIKQRCPATEVIMLSGTPAEGGAASWTVQAVKGGAFDCLSKSAGFSFPKVLACVSNALQRRSQAHSSPT